MKTLQELERTLAAMDAMPLAKVPAAEVGLSLTRRLRPFDGHRETLPQPLRDIALVLAVDDTVMLAANGFRHFVRSSPAVLLATREAVERIEGSIRQKVFATVLSYLPAGWERRSPQAHRRAVKKLLESGVGRFLRGHDRGWQYAHRRWPNPSPQAAKFIRENVRELDRALKLLTTGESRRR